MAEQKNEESGAGSDSSNQGDGSTPQHEDMYAGVSNLFAACEATNATRPKRHRSEEEKRQERLSANRRSARESRNRKKLVFEELQRSVARLAEENASLRKENETIRAQMTALKRQFGLLDGADTGGQGGVSQSLGGQPGIGVGGIDLTQGLNATQQGDNQGGSGGSNMDQAQQLAMLEAAQQAQAQQQLQLAAAGLNPFAANSSAEGGDGQGSSDYQERLQLFQRRVEERSQLINQLKNSIGGGGGGGMGMSGQSNNNNLEALRRQLQQQGQGGDKMAMGTAGNFLS